LENLDGNEGGLLVIPNGIAGGLARGGGKLLGIFDGAPDGLGGLEALENSVQN
jgi:hypothetical protein